MKNNSKSISHLTAWMLLAAGLLAATTVAEAQPVPAQPSIVYGGLVGHRVCGNFSEPGTTFTFGCDPLPTKIATGWQLTPLFKTDGAGKPAANTGVIIRVTTPSFTNLYVEYEDQAGTKLPLAQIVSGPGTPQPRDLGPNGQVGVASDDNGTVKTWSLQFIVNTCTDWDRVNIYNVGANGLRNPNPVPVYLLRDRNEMCSGGVGGGVILRTQPVTMTPSAMNMTACRCTQTGQFTGIAQHSVSGGTTGTFTNSLGTFVLSAQPSGTAATVSVGFQKSATQIVPVFSATAIGWGLSPGNQFFTVVSPLVGTNAGAPVQVFKVSNTRFTSVVSTTAWPDGFWGYSPDGGQFVVGRGRNVQSGNSVALEFGFQDYNLIGQHPSTPAVNVTELGAQGPSLAFAPCGNMLMYFRWTQLNPLQGQSSLYTVTGTTGGAPIIADATGTTPPVASIATGSSALDFIVALQGARLRGTVKASSNQCSAP